MKLASIITARAVALIDVDEFNLMEHVVRLADTIPLLVREFGFLTFPTKIEDFDFEKGVKFGSGKIGDIVIESFTLFPGMITAQTLSSTRDSQTALKNILEWGRDTLGLTYEDGMLRRWGFISQLSFSSQISLLNSISDPLSNLARKTGEFVEGLFEEGLSYEVSKVVVGHDPLKRKNGIASLTIEHRTNVKFGDNKYFSEAPVQTDVHIRLLEEFEAEIMESMK